MIGSKSVSYTHLDVYKRQVESVGDVGVMHARGQRGTVCAHQAGDVRSGIDIQKAYFQDGDESDLKPMILKDVADKTGLDISTKMCIRDRRSAPWP